MNGLAIRFRDKAAAAESIGSGGDRTSVLASCRRLYHNRVAQDAEVA
jgi:hypothetical protein